MTKHLYRALLSDEEIDALVEAGTRAYLVDSWTTDPSPALKSAVQKLQAIKERVVLASKAS